MSVRVLTAPRMLRRYALPPPGIAAVGRSVAPSTGGAIGKAGPAPGVLPITSGSSARLVLGRRPSEGSR